MGSREYSGKLGFLESEPSFCVRFRMNCILYFGRMGVVLTSWALRSVSLQKQAVNLSHLRDTETLLVAAGPAFRLEVVFLVGRQLR